MAPGREPILEVRDLTRRYGGLVAVDRVSFALRAGGIIGVIGPNGAGKTTLLGMIGGEIRPSEGTVRFLGGDVTGCKPHVLCHRGLTRTFQIPRPFSSLTVEENVRIALRFGGGAAADLDQVLESCRLAGRKATRAGDLTHTEQRQLEFARSLATDPRVMLLDEVGAGLSSPELEAFAELIRVVRARGVALLVVEHIMSLVMEVSDHIVVMETGRKIAEGPPKEVARDPAVITAYLGESA